MNAEQLKALQTPLKQQYRENPDAAIIKLKAQGHIGANVTCKVDTGKALVEAGLHPSAGGDGLSACSGDMLLEALVACAGVTLNAVATALNINLRDAQVIAEGNIDMRGTLGVAKEAAVGFTDIQLRFELDTDASAEQIDSLLKLTERYCVIFQTLQRKPELVVSHQLRS